MSVSPNVSASPYVADTSVLIEGHRIAQGRFGAGEPVVLMHGTPAFSFLWRKVVPLLIENGHEVFVFDLFGYGRSERPQDPGVDTSVTAQMPILLGLLDHWGLETAHFVGTDLGGAMAMMIGLDHPERARSLSFIDSVTFDSWPSPRTLKLIEGGLDKLLTADDEAHRAHFKEWLRSAVYHQEQFEAEALEVYLEQISGPIGQASMIQHQIRHYDPVHTMRLVPRLGELSKLPVQIAWGRNDVWQVIDWAHRLSEAIPGAPLTVLEECAHFAMEDQPEAIAEWIANLTLAIKQKG